MKSLVLRDWYLGFALLLGCAQDFVLLFFGAAKLCVKRLVLRGLVFRFCSASGLSSRLDA